MFKCDKSKSLREIIEEIDAQHELHLLERVELAMLIAAATGDVSIQTMGACLDVEQEIEFPISEEDNSLIDTEFIYNIVDEVAKDIIKERY